MIVAELKAVKQLAGEHRAQVINYLKSTGMQLGLMVNFGYFPLLEHERFVNEVFSPVSRFSQLKKCQHRLEALVARDAPEAQA